MAGEKLTKTYPSTARQGKINQVREYFDLNRKVALCQRSRDLNISVSTLQKTLKKKLKLKSH